ncbi:MAG: bile acid:sodium symporter family protein [Vicinamibacterales bacterium]
MDAAAQQLVIPVPRPAWRVQLTKLVSDWFLIGMVAGVVVASIAPTLGMSGGVLRVDKVSDWGIFAIFFLHGIALSTERLKQGLSRWPVHIVVQVFTFLIFPIIGIVVSIAGARFLPPDLVLGFIYLCVLPSTVSSSVAMTALARGNVAASIFNATLSTLIGVFMTPLWVSLLIGVSGNGGSLGGMILNVATLLLLPFVIGQALRPVLGTWFARYKPWTNIVDRGVILLLVWSAFSDSVANGLWRDHGWTLIAMTLAVSAVILMLVLWLSRKTAQQLSFSPEDEITTVFCGSKKTLASGVPMARVIFGSHPALGVIVLPLMFYHQLQLFVCSVLAQRYAQRSIT